MKNTKNAPSLQDIASDASSIVITANARQLRHLETKYLDTQFQHLKTSGVIDRGLQGYSYSQFIHHLWGQLQQLLPERYSKCIATSLQCQYLWRQVIEDDDEQLALLNPDQLANTAKTALETLTQWQLDINEVDDGRADPKLKLWGLAFETKLEKSLLITESQACSAIIQAFESGLLVAHQSLYCFGFDLLSPQQLQLFEVAANQMEVLALRHFHKPVQVAHSGRAGFADLSAQARAAALWAKETLEADSKAHIAIVVANLGQCRGVVERELVRCFEAELYQSECERYTLPFNFSAGVPLSSCPIIYDALSLLALARKSWPQADVAQLLSSRFIGFNESDQRLLQDLETKVAVSNLSQIDGQFIQVHADRCAKELIEVEQLEPKLHGRLRKFFELLGLKTKRLPSQWVDVMLGALDSVNWPGPQGLDSHEFQQVEQFYELFAQLADFDSLTKPCSLLHALGLLSKICESNHFQPQVPASPIQVLGALEAAGLEFSHSWLLGFDQQIWPPKAAPNPLLASEFQRREKMPHASSERELEFCQSLSDFYTVSSTEIWVSYNQVNDDTPAGPSPLFCHLPGRDFMPENQLTAIEQCYGQQRQLLAREFTQEQLAPPLGASEIQLVRGGSGLIKDQACCPFLAFAKYRLGVKMLEPISIGLSALEKGNLIHDTLAAVWQAIETSEKLASLSVDECDEVILSALDQELARFNKARQLQMPVLHWRQERERIARLIKQWLKLELERSTFKVAEIEQEQQLELAGLPLNLRLDRLDLIESGGLVIDYKTGTTNTNNWLPSKLTEPQLPLYAIARQSAVRPITALAFAQINAREIKLQGLSESPIAQDGLLSCEQKNRSIKGSLPRFPESWPELISAWQEALESLSRDFQRGRCDVHFIDRLQREYAADLRCLTRDGEDFNE